MENKRKIAVLMLAALSISLAALPFAGCAPAADDGTDTVGQGRTLKYADLNWDSARVHNRIAAFILDNGYGYTSEFIPGEEAALWQGMKRADVDILMETWTQNMQDLYNEVVENGPTVDLGTNYPDNWQGWLIPRYMVEGDQERGIEPMAPDLETVFDLEQYWELFTDGEHKDEGVLYSCPPGVGCGPVNKAKLQSYGLADRFTAVSPSYTALLASLVASYEKGDAWLGYYWEPSWVIGKLDMIRLEEPEYDPDLWNESAGFACAYPPNDVNIIVHETLLEEEPVAVEFFETYQTTAEQNNRFLAYMEENEANWDDAALWFLNEYESVWTQWVTADVAERVKAAM